MTPEFYRIDNNVQTLIFEKSGNNIYWRYWGEKLSPKITMPTSIHSLRPIASFSMDSDFAPSIVPTFGNGWFNQSAILFSRNGHDFAQSFDGCEIDANVSSLKFKLSDNITKFEVEIQFSTIPDTEIFSVKSIFKNLGNSEINLENFAGATLLLPQTISKVCYFGGRHNNEFQKNVENLERSIWLRENRRGLSSHDCMPAALAFDYADYDMGDIYGAVLAWSGNSRQIIERLDGGNYQWQLGEWFAPNEMKISSGEIYQAPEVLIGFSNLGFNGIANNFYAAMRNRITWPNNKMAPRPIHINTWEGFYFDHNEPQLKQLADAAAALKIERFVLDDGWFKGRNDDTAALGDWAIDTKKYPNGLLPLAQHIVDLGMEFGLWVEPEMISPNSDLYRANPDWALHIEGRESLTARNQLVLNLSLSQVRDYLFDAIDKLLKELPISYLKWDHNRDLTQVSSKNCGALYHAQIIGAYDLFSRIRVAHPNVEIEACAGGGGRIDAAILQYTHRFWISDCIDAVSRIAIQDGFLQFFPPELMGSHIGASPAHSTGRSQNMDFRASVAIQGHFGIELDARILSEDEKLSVAKYNQIYKDIRPIIHKNVWRGNAGDGIFFQAQGDFEQFILFIYRIEPTKQRFAPLIKMPFLRNDFDYEITQIAPIKSEDKIIFNAKILAQHGFNIPYQKAENSLIYRFKRTCK